MKRSSVGIAALVVLAMGCTSSSSSGTSAADGGTTDDVTFGGSRPVSFFHAPANYDPSKPAPLVLLLHGYGASGALQDAIFRLASIADQEGFFLVAPDGTVDSTQHRFWNATDTCCDFENTHVDDVAYLTGLVAEIEKKYAIDPKRRFVVGHSNGGSMAYRLACDAADRFAAIVSLAGPFFSDASKCKPSAPVAVQHIHGTADTTVPYAGGEDRRGPSQHRRDGARRRRRREGLGRSRSLRVHARRRDAHRRGRKRRGRRDEGRSLRVVQRRHRRHPLDDARLPARSGQPRAGVSEPGLRLPEGASQAMTKNDADVVVVGAGFAGLEAARTLGRRGTKVVVLEARDRVGGRVMTTKLDAGPWVDLGGQWIGPTQHAITALAKELAIETFPTWTRGDNLVIVNGKPKRYRGTIPRLALPSLLNIGWAQWRLERMSKTVPLDAPWKAARAAEWDARSLGDWLDANIKTKTARELFDAGLETVFAASGHDISLLHALFYVHSGGNLDILLGTDGCAQATRMVGGMQPVAEKLAASLDVRLSCPVRRIENGDGGVLVHHDQGVLRASRVVVAIPPKLVPEIRFEPALTGPRAELVKKMPMGAVIKHTAVYDRPFWRDEKLSGMVVCDEGPIHVVFDNSLPDAKQGILMGFCEASAAKKLGALSEAERKREALSCFTRYFGERAAKPLAYVDHVWEHDPWSGGCYGAFMPPGVWTSLGPSIREPQGRIHWAGTETAEVWSGYIDGALTSGQRVAKEILALG